MFVAASSDPSVRRGRPTSVDPFQGVTNVTRRFDEGMHSNPLVAKGHQRALSRQAAPGNSVADGQSLGLPARRRMLNSSSRKIRNLRCVTGFGERNERAEAAYGSQASFGPNAMSLVGAPRTVRACAARLSAVVLDKWN